MSISEMQSCLARLYVDEPFRRLLRLEPEATLNGYCLTPDERAAIEGINAQMLDFFAASLVNKRRKRIERAFPLLFLLDSHEMERYYARYFQLATAWPGSKFVNEVVAFGGYLEENLLQPEKMPMYARDLAKYELLYYLASFFSSAEAVTKITQHSELVAKPSLDSEARPRLRDGVRIANFHYDVINIEKALQEGITPHPERLDPGFAIVFCPTTSESSARMMRLNHSSKVVLDHCNGCRDVLKIATDVQSTLGTEGLENAISDTVNRLLSAQVLVLVTDPYEEVSAIPRFQGTAPNEAM